MAISGFNILMHSICMLIGASLGIGISFIVNCALIEVSRSKLFSIYFAVSFLIIGMYILIRSLRSMYTSYQNPDYIQVNHKESFRHRYLFCLSLLIIFASFFSFFLHSQFVVKLYYVVKVPIYAILVVSGFMGMAFGMVFGIMDMEDVSAKLIKDYLMKEENYCIPIGVILGAIGGLFVSSTDNSEAPQGENAREFSPLKQEDEIEI